MNDDVQVPVEVDHTVTVPVEALLPTPAEPAPDPDHLIDAEVRIAEQDAETERARIVAETAVEIARIQSEEPPWLNDIREYLIRLEAMLMEMRQSLTPAQSTVVITEPPEPEPEPTPEPTPEPEPEGDVVTLEPGAVPEPEAPKPKRRWI